MNGIYFKPTFDKKLNNMTNEQLIYELLKRQEIVEIDSDQICTITRCTRSEYLEASLEQMTCKELRAFENIFYEIYYKRKAIEDEDYENSLDYQNTIETLNKTFNIRL